MCEDFGLCWQQHGNKKSDNPYYLNHGKNAYPLSQIP